MINSRILIFSLFALICYSNCLNYQYLWQYVPNTVQVTGRQYAYHNFNLYITADGDMRPEPDQDDSFVVYRKFTDTYSFVSSGGDFTRKMIASDPASWKRFFYPDITASLGPVGDRYYVLYDLTFTCECWNPKNTKSCVSTACPQAGKYQLKVNGKMRVFTCPSTASAFANINGTPVSVANGGSGNGKKYAYVDGYQYSTSNFYNAGTKILGVMIENIFKPTVDADIPVCGNPCDR